MVDLVYSAGRPNYDWQALLSAVLDNGVFDLGSATSTSVSLDFGTIELVLNGTGLAVSGARTITAGTVTELVLSQGGVTILNADSFGTNIAASVVQQVLFAYDNGTPDLQQIIAGILGDDTVFGRGSANDDTMVGLGNDDYLEGRGGNDTLFGYDGDDGLNGGAGGDYMDGGDGDDFFQGFSGADTIVGGGDWDKVSYEREAGSTGISATFLGGGNFTVVDTFGFTDSGSGIEAIKGSARADTFTGSGDDDHAEGMGGGDTFNMGGGDDTVEYVHEATDAGTTVGVIVNLATSAVSANIGTGTFVVQAGQARDSFGATDILNGVESIIGTMYADYIVGSAGDNDLDGDDGNDELFGGNGYDSLQGAGGNDILRGGLLADYFSGGQGNDTFIGGDGGTDDYDLVSYESESGASGIVVNFSAAETFVATDTYGNTDNASGIEEITGSFRADIINGGSGNEVVTGMAGNDIFNLGAGDHDRVDYQDESNVDETTHGVVVNLSNAQITSTGGVGSHTVAAFNARDVFGDTDSLSGVEDVAGSSFADYILGDTAANFIQGRDGNDILLGGIGADTLVGGQGNDELFGGKGFDFLYGDDGDDVLTGAFGADHLDGGLGSDTASYSSADAGLVADLKNAASNTGQALGDTFSSIENLIGTAFSDELRGNTGANILRGGTGNDTLLGGAGDDQLFGGQGNDTLTGGLNNDRFIFAAGLGQDTVTDFAGGSGIGDILQLSLGSAFNSFAEVQAAMSQVGGSTVINFGGGNTITLANTVFGTLVADDFSFV